MLLGRYFRKFYIKYGWYFLFGIIALIVVDYFQLKIPDIIGKIIDGLENKTLDKAVLFDLSLDILFVALAVFVGRFLWRICIFGNGVRIETDIRNDMFSHMIKLSQEKYSKNKTGAIMALYTNDLALIRNCFGSGTIMAVDALALGALAFYKMIMLNYKIAIMSLIPLVIVMVFSRLMGMEIRKRNAYNLKVYSDLSDFVQEDYLGISVVKAFVIENIKLNIFRKKNQENMNSTVRIAKASSFVQVTIGAVLSTISLMIILIGGYYIYKQAGGVETFTIGDLTRFSAYFGTLVWPIMAIGGLITMKNQGEAAASRVMKLLDEEIEINDDRAIDDITLDGEIEVRDLTFTYPGSDHAKLKHLNLKINKGEFIGVMGATACGKSTLMDLLVRMYNVEDGHIFYDGHDINNISLKNLREGIALATQESFIFKDTITNNICFALDEANIEQARKFAIISDVDKDIKNFTNGYDTEVGERGVTVSGGQKQRIAIARALLKDAPILILDDSLSAVDVITEDKIIKKLHEMRRGKTTIIIAHRISTLKTLDKIAVIENGCVSGFGTHEELYETNETYHREVKLQELEKERGDRDEIKR